MNGDPRQPVSGNGERTDLVLRLFGRPEILLRGEPMPAPRTRKGLWLLALLALRGGAPAERRWLAGLFWPESPEELALYNLRRSLSDLRDRLGAEAGRLVAPTPRSLALRLDTASVDALQFDRCLARGDAAGLDEAAALYRGPLLEGCTEEWVLPERDTREQALLGALEARAAAEAAGGDPARAARRWSEVLRHDPFREAALRGLMEALHAVGDYPRATQAYQEFRALLRRELNTAPAPETVQLFRTLRESAARTLRAAPCRAERSLRGRLPAAIPPLVGREREVEQVREALRGRRAVVLTGPGGVGKTRLALAVVEEVAAELPDGAWFADLSALSDPALVPHSVAQALEVRVGGARTPEEALRDALGGRTGLLVLDNCEHLAESCAELAGALLRACPALLLLATSRHVLELPAAVQLPVPPLPAPAAAAEEEPGDVETLLSFESVRFFVDRARRALPSFELTARNARSVARICARLDGIPLALELAAARVWGLTPEQIAARLDELLPRLFTLPSPEGSRHRTLRAAMEWSYGLLTEPERTLLPRLSVFAGGFTLDAAEAVCAGEGVRPAAVIDLLLQLLERSLIQYEEVDGEGRYRLLETIRAYAAEKLRAGGDEERIRERHRRFYSALAEQAEPGILSPREAEWLARLDRERDNFRAALQACGGDSERVELAGALWRYWYDRGLIAEGLRWLEESLAPSDDTAAAARARLGVSLMRWVRGDVDAAQQRLIEALDIYVRRNDTRGEATLLNALGTYEAELGRHRAAEEMLERSLALFRELRDTRGVGFVLENLAIHALSLGEFDRAEGLLEESETLLRAVRCEQTIGGVLLHKALVAVHRGDFQAARRLLEESLEIHRRFGHRENSAHAACSLGALLAALGEPESARPFLAAGVSEWRALGGRRALAGALTAFAWLSAHEGDPRRAARLAAAADALRAAHHFPLPPAWRAIDERFRERLRAELPAEALAAAREAGSRLALEEAVALALMPPPPAHQEP